MEATTKKGLSKGCIICLVITGIMVVLVVASGFICYSQRNAISIQARLFLVKSIKTELVNRPVDGVDTVVFNAVADGFMERVNAQDSIYDIDRRIMKNKFDNIFARWDSLTVSDVDNLMQAMVSLYPGLKDSIPERSASEGTAGEENDSTRSK